MEPPEYQYKEDDEDRGIYNVWGVIAIIGIIIMAASAIFATYLWIIGA